MEYRIEDLKLLDIFGKYGYIKFADLHRYVAKLSMEDKLYFANTLNNNRYFDIVYLIWEYNEALVNGEIKCKDGVPYTNSKIAWMKRIKKHGALKDANIVSNYGYINNVYFSHNICKDCLLDKNYLYSKNGCKYTMLDAFVYESINGLYKKEMEYFCTHDEAMQLNKVLLKYTNSYGWLMNGVCYSSKCGFAIVDDNNNIIRPLTITEMHELIARYEQLEKVMEELTIDFSIRV